MSVRITCAALAALTCTPALADPPPIATLLCETRDRLALRLSAMGAMQPVGQGLRDPSTMLEIWATPEGRWTLVQADASGIACILAMGEGWEGAPMPPRDPA